MSRIIKKWPLSPTNEIIWMGFVGMGLTAIEESCVDLQQSLYYIWTQTFPYDSFSEETQEVIKSVLSGIVLVRSLTVHLYFFSYFAMLMMAIFEEVPVLALPWLTVSLLRNFLLDMLAFLTGIFICIRYELAPVCYEFILYKICEMSVSIYLWASVLKLRRDISCPNGSTGDMVLTRAECLPRRAKEQEVPEEAGFSPHCMQEAAGEEEEEEEEYELEADEGGPSESEDEGVQVSTLSRKFLKQAEEDLGYGTPDDEEGMADADEDDGNKSEATQVSLLSNEFLTQAEESASNNKWSVEVQVNTVSYEFLSQEAEKMKLASVAPFGTLPLIPP